MTKTSYAADETSFLRWRLDIQLPAELKRTTHARSIVRIRREQKEVREELATR